MASEGERCGGLGFLAMSCKGRAEAFARRLHSKLRSLGTQDDNGSANESSWLAAHENPITISQPGHSGYSNSDNFLNFNVLESPASPEEELEEIDFNQLMNKDTLELLPTKEHVEINKSAFFSTNSLDSDSDSTFYDTEDQRIVQPSHTNGIESFEDDSDTYQNSADDCSSTSECTSQQIVSLSEDISLLSLRDEDLPVEINGSSTDFFKCNGDINGKCDNFGNEILVSNEKSDNDTECVKSYEKETTNLLKNDDEELEQAPRVRRSTSLKTGKTPPGTPGQKKIVRFADALGLDLADVRTFLDDIPKIPNSAFQDLSNADLSESSSDSISFTHRVQLKATKYLMPMFQQPGGLPNFLDVVRECNVCLENCFVDDPFLLSLKGSVRVRNLDFHKSVHIRYTLDAWKTFADVQATYVENSCDGFSDKFTFLLYAHTLSIGQRLEIACRFQCRGFQYWDNNRGVNYCFQCLPATQHHPDPVVPAAHDDWGGASFY